MFLCTGVRCILTNEIEGYLLTTAISDLAKLALDGAGEQTVREKLITPLLEHLGYDLDKDYEVRRDGDKMANFKLKLPAVRGGGKVSASFKPDYVPTVRKKVFWVMDAKRPSPKVDDRFIAQVLQYAVHPEIQARYAVLINGVNILVYDVKAEFFDLQKSVYNPFLSLPVRDLEIRFKEVQQLLGNEMIRERLVAELESDFTKLSMVSLDEEFPKRVVYQLQHKIPDLQRHIRQQSLNVWMAQRDRETKQFVKILQEASLSELVEMCKFPLGPRFLNPSEELARRLLDGVLSVNDVLQPFSTEPLSTYSHCNYLMLLAMLLGKLDESLVQGQSIVERICTLVTGPLPLRNRLECVIIRIFYKFRVLKVNPLLRQQVQQMLTLLNEKQRAAKVVSVEGFARQADYAVMHNVIRHVRTIPEEELMAHINRYEEMEECIDSDYREERWSLPKDEVYAGGGLGVYGTWEPRLRRNLLNEYLNDGQKELLPKDLGNWLANTSMESDWCWSKSEMM